MNQEQTEKIQENPFSCFSIIKPMSSDRNPIYHAYDTKFNRHVVLKTFPNEFELSKSYTREKSYLKVLNHPNIIQLFESNDLITTSHLDSFEKKLSYLAIEYAPRGDLLEIISKHGPLPEVLARTLFHQLIDAVAYLHRRNIAHMDLKVENLLLDDSFQLKVSDFDLSQSLDSSFLEVAGTPGYRAPEIKNGVCGNLRAADVYSAAVIIFIMICGYPPYQEHAKGEGTDYDAYYKLFRKNADRFWEVHGKHKNNPDFFSASFKELFCSMLREDPRNRASLEEIKQSAWYNSPVLEKDSFIEEMRKYLKEN